MMRREARARLDRIEEQLDELLIVMRGHVARAEAQRLKELHEAQVIPMIDGLEKVLARRASGH